MSKDLLLYENGSGGELHLNSSDLVLVNSLYQQVYLSLFGGNIEANTATTKSQENNDWWGNDLIFKNNSKKQFNSNTERALNNVTLNPSGRIDILRAVLYDLRILKEISNISASVHILETNKVQINVLIAKPNSIENKELQFIWDSAKNELIHEKII